MNEFKEAKIIMLGLDGAGKTSIYNKLCEIDKPLKPTSGFNTKKIPYNEDFTLDLWEIGGAEALRPKWKMIFKNVDGVVFVVDNSAVANEEKFEEVKQCFTEYVLNAEQLKGTPILILANKMDVKGSQRNLGTTQSLLKLNTAKERAVLFRNT